MMHFIEPASFNYRQVDGRYYARIRCNSRVPTTKSWPLKTNSEREAQQRLKELERAYYAGAFDPWAGYKRDMPECIKSASQYSNINFQTLRRLQFPNVVYLLCDSQEVLYVGKTTTPLPCRVDQHQKDDRIPFDRVYYVSEDECDELSVNEVEKALISHFEPSYNRIQYDAAASETVKVLLNLGLLRDAH